MSMDSNEAGRDELRAPLPRTLQEQLKRAKNLGPIWVQLAVA